MNRISLMIFVVFCCFSTALTFAADAEKKLTPKSSGKEATKSSDSLKNDKLKQKKILLDKTKPKASGNPHVEDDPIGTKSGKQAK